MNEIDEVKYHAIGYDDRNRRRHTHVGYYEILLCHSDGGSFLIGENVYPLKQNTLFIINADAIHCSAPDDPSGYERSVVLFSANYIKSVLSVLGVADMLGGILPEKGGIHIPLNGENAEFVNACVDRVDRCIKKNSRYKRAVVTNEIVSLLLRLSELEDDEHKREESYGGGQLISQILRFINNNLTDCLDTARISENVGVSGSYLCRYFKKQTGMTLTHYITEQRLALARSMLEQTDKTALEIAVLCGFSESSYFCRQFKNCYSMSPLEYRRHANK